MTPYPFFLTLFRTTRVTPSSVPDPYDFVNLKLHVSLPTFHQRLSLFLLLSCGISSVDNIHTSYPDSFYTVQLRSLLYFWFTSKSLIFFMWWTLFWKRPNRHPICDVFFFTYLNFCVLILDCFTLCIFSDFFLVSKSLDTLS